MSVLHGFAQIHEMVDWVAEVGLSTIPNRTSFRYSSSTFTSLKYSQFHLAGAMPDISRATIIWTIIGVVTLWALTPAVFYLLPLNDMAERGQLGDIFGSINALFSGLAFAGVVFAILLQRQELALQRQELKETRLEVTRTADAQEAAQQALNKTIWAQSYKVVLDILQEPNVVTARGNVWNSRSIIMGEKPDIWPLHVRKSAELVSRTFESVGTMVRKGLLPIDYITDTWSMPIAKQWRVLEAHNRTLRDDWGDPFLARDFEFLADAANDFLKKNGVGEIKYI